MIQQSQANNGHPRNAGWLFLGTLGAMAQLLTMGCTPSDIEGTQFKFDVTGEEGFFEAPFPVSWRLEDDGTPFVTDIPLAKEPLLVTDLLRTFNHSKAGFGLNTGVFFTFDGPLDAESLPSAIETLDPAASVQIVLVDAESGDLVGERVPARVTFKAEAETYSPANVLCVMPEPGHPMRPGMLYAVLVTDGVTDGAGEALGSPLALEMLKANQAPDSMGAADAETFLAALDVLAASMTTSDIRALTVFRTGDPLSETRDLAAQTRASVPPSPDNIRLIAEYDTYCVIEGDLTIPVWQHGNRPYEVSGGDIRVTDGVAELAFEEVVRFAVTIPKTASAGDALPLLFYSAGQGGAYTQIIDRAPAAIQDQGIEGQGPAVLLTDVGIATISIEAPLVGPRHPNGDVGGLQFFNPSNPIAFRDNTRQAAMDFVQLVRMAQTLEIPAAACDTGAAQEDIVTFDDENFFFWGHSTGATVGSVLLGVEPLLRANVLSGVGGAWYYNLTIKQEPLDFKALVNVLLEYDEGDEVEIDDPMLWFAQAAWEPMEPMNWAPYWSTPDPRGERRTTLIIEGVVDGYFPPLSVSALAAAAEVELFMTAVEPTVTAAIELTESRGKRFAGMGGQGTNHLVQWQSPEGLDGHYVPFEVDAARHLYKCFFASAINADPALATPVDDAFAACP